MKKLMFFGLCFLLLLAYGCGKVSETESQTESLPESSAVDADTVSEGGKENASDGSSVAAESIPDESEESKEPSSAESGAESSESSSQAVPDDSIAAPPEESSNTPPEESSETPPEESSEILPEESSEIPPEESSEIPPEESSEYIEDTSSEDPNESEGDGVQGLGDAELLPTGYVLYNGAAYHVTNFYESVAKAYADTYARYAELFPDTRITVINPPQSAININNPAVRALVADQGEILDKTEECIYGNVNFVNLRKIFEQHRGEYLFFKSDYHWTQRGAYYAYYAFAKSLGMIPTPLESFEEKVVTTHFVGAAYTTAGDNRVTSYIDTIYAYMPIKQHTMTVYNSRLEVDRVYNNCIYVKRESYSCFITGDQPYTVINVPSNDQSKTALVIKESSGNAFVPFLTEHYGNIIVIDPRHINIDIRKLVKEQGVDDIIFHATASTSSRTAYNDYYRMLIGE